MTAVEHTGGDVDYTGANPLTANLERIRSPDTRDVKTVFNW